MHNEIHNTLKPREALPSQVFQVVAKGQRLAKGIFCLVHKGHIGSPKKGSVPFGRGLAALDTVEEHPPQLRR